MSDAPINRRRDEFPTLAEGAYLLSHSLGPMPRGASASMQAYLDQWRTHTSEDAWASSWWELSRAVGDRVARVIGAEPGTVLPLPNATLAMAAIASCLDYHDRPKVVTTALDFPSMGYLWRAQEALGAEVHVVPSEDGVTLDPDRLLSAIDERTGIVAISHVSYRSSFRVDAAAVARRARAVGALSLLDAYQSAGVCPIRAGDCGVDVLIAGSIKWLCGGPAAGYLYVRPDLVGSLQPRLTGWIAHENPFEFAHAPMRYASDVRRFAQGTPVIPALYSVIPGLDIITDVGVEAIAAESRSRTQRIVEHALERGWPLRSPTDPDHRGGTVMLGFENPERCAERLRGERVFVDWRPGVGIRLSPHFFNTDDEISAALDAIGRLADGGAPR